MNNKTNNTALAGKSVWWYDEEDNRVYKGFRISKVLDGGLVEIAKAGEGLFTVKRSELAFPGGIAIDWDR